jgi:hypothetical protein
MNAQPPLHQALSDNLFNKLGSSQHLEIAGYLRSAKKIYVDSSARAAAAQTWDESPWTIESNIDQIVWPSEPTWYEMPGYLRSIEGGDNPQVGFLVMRHPSFYNLIMIITGYSTSEIVANHCYATAIIDLDAMNESAFRARRFYSHARAESMERVMSNIGVTLSPDFEDELMLTYDDNRDVVDAVMRDASADIPLLLSLLVARQSANGFIIDFNGDKTTWSNAPKQKRNAIGKIADRLERRLSSGIVRTRGARGKPRLVWFA